MMNRKYRKVKKNNKGLTLVEVIVAIAVLSVAILPLLYTFVYTAKFNMKSREKQRATSAAQAIIENFKAYSMEDIKDQFVHDTFDIGTKSTEASNATLNYYYDATEDKTVFVVMNANYEKMGIETKASYDAVITVNRYNKSTDTYKGKLLSINSNNRYNDAVYRVDESLDETNYQEIMREINSQYRAITDKASGERTDLNATDLNKIKVTRVLNLTISEPYTGVYKVVAGLQYKYTQDGSIQYKDGSNVTKNFTFTAGAIDATLENGGVIYDSTSTRVSNGAKLERLYVYFYPIYTEFSYVPIYDEIVITNTQSTISDLPIFVYKQKKYVLSDSQTDYYESMLHNAKRTQMQLSGTRVKLYHNFDINLGKVGDTNPVGPALITDIVTSGNYVLGSVDDFMDTPATGTNEENNSLSEIDVKIYRGGTVSLLGEASNPDNLLEDMKGSFNGRD